jgi:DNA repair protein RadC
MTTKVIKSTASISFIRGMYYQDLQLVTNDYEFFCSLPGKFERIGIKTIAKWPIFVTLFYIDHNSRISPDPNDGNHRIAEGQSSAFQIPLFENSISEDIHKSRLMKHRVEQTLAKIRILHDKLNTQLYAYPSERPVIHSPKDAYEILKYFMNSLDHEELWVVNLDTRNRIMSMVSLYKGSVNSSQVRVGEVFNQAILNKSPSIIVAHNHPSGDPTPSPDDVAVTRAIVHAGKLLDIDVLDHLVIGSEYYASLKERGIGFD